MGSQGTAMPIRYDDADCYQFHEDDNPNRCFLCGQNTSRLIIVRHLESMKMTHLCESCFISNLSDYLLDNTRPWLGSKKP